MTTRTAPAPTGAPCWIDLSTSDEAATIAFYGSLFGWTADDAAADFGGYRNLRKDGVLVAGCMRGDTNAWGVHLAVDEPEKVEANAPAVVAPPMAVGTLGTMVQVTDPGGALVGGWKAGEHLGYGVYGEPGTVSWIELHTNDYDASVAFYRDVFGWDAHTVADEPGFRYTTYGVDDDALAGIVDSSGWPGDALGWQVYFGSADVDASVAEAVALGATVVDQPEDTPYGRLATLRDPNGALLKLRG